MRAEFNIQGNHWSELNTNVFSSLKIFYLHKTNLSNYQVLSLGVFRPQSTQGMFGFVSPGKNRSGNVR